MTVDRGNKELHYILYRGFKRFHEGERKPHQPTMLCAPEVSNLSSIWIPLAGWSNSGEGCCLCSLGMCGFPGVSIWPLCDTKRGSRWTFLGLIQKCSSYILIHSVHLCFQHRHCLHYLAEIIACLEKACLAFPFYTLQEVSWKHVGGTFHICTGCDCEHMDVGWQLVIQPLTGTVQAPVNLVAEPCV